MKLPLAQVFDDSQPLCLLSRVRDASGRGDGALIRDLTFFIRDLKTERDAYKTELRDLKRKLEAHESVATAEEPAMKKRKLPDHSSTDAQSTVASHSAHWRQFPVVCEVPDISFSLPMRKKLVLQLVEGPSPTDGGISIKTAGDGQDDVYLDWTDIEQVICVPVPEKAQPSYHFIVFPKSSAPSATGVAPGPLMWTVPSASKPLAMNKDYRIPAPDAPLDILLRHILDTHLASFDKRTIIPVAAEFTSQLVQAHRKGEIAYHVKAFRGSKEGFLYFLPTGILFAPRAPLLYFPFHTITSISYSSVLQRTFNLNISARLSATGVPVLPPPSAGDSDGEPLETEFEFAMLDQADFAGIDAYVKRHGLHDASLAERRRAKVYNVNPTGTGTKAVANGDDAVTAGAAPVVQNGVTAPGEDDGESELAKAERALQDAEDEEEEDYDPSGGESEGSGTESEEEGDAGDEVEGGNDEDAEDDGDDL